MTRRPATRSLAWSGEEDQKEETRVNLDGSIDRDKNIY
jgi:hypothetical protein